MHHECMYELGGAEKGKSEKHVGFFRSFDWSKRLQGFFRRAAAERAEPLLGDFGVTLGIFG